MLGLSGRDLLVSLGAFLVGSDVDDFCMCSGDLNVSTVLERYDCRDNFVNKSKLSFGGYLVPLSCLSLHTTHRSAKQKLRPKASN